jgi:hypothetical protein
VCALLPLGSLRSKIKLSMPEHEVPACQFTWRTPSACDLLDNLARSRTPLYASYRFDLFVATR